MAAPSLAPPDTTGLPGPFGRWLKLLWDVVRGDANLDSTLGTVVSTNGTQTLTNKTLTPGAWVSLSLQNSWVSYGAPYLTPAYRKLPDGIVELRGCVKNGSSGTADIATLPAGARPTEQVVIPVYSNAKSVFVVVTAAGVITGLSSATETADAANIILNPIRFPTT